MDNSNALNHIQPKLKLLVKYNESNEVFWHRGTVVKCSRIQSDHINHFFVEVDVQYDHDPHIVYKETLYEKDFSNCFSSDAWTIANETIMSKIHKAQASAESCADAAPPPQDATLSHNTITTSDDAQDLEPPPRPYSFKKALMMSVIVLFLAHLFRMGGFHIMLYKVVWGQMSHHRSHVVGYSNVVYKWINMMMKNIMNFRAV